MNLSCPSPGPSKDGEMLGVLGDQFLTSRYGQSRDGNMIIHILKDRAKLVGIYFLHYIPKKRNNKTVWLKL